MAFICACASVRVDVCMPSGAYVCACARLCARGSVCARTGVRVLRKCVYERTRVIARRDCVVIARRSVRLPYCAFVLLHRLQASVRNIDVYTPSLLNVLVNFVYL